MKVTLMLKSTLLGLIVPFVLICSWEILVATDFVNGIFFPPPSRIFETAIQLASQGALTSHLVSTMGRLLPGFLIGAGLGTLFGLGLGTSRQLRQLLEPTLAALYSIPKIALLPIFFAVFGAGQSALVGLVSLSVFFYVWIYTMGSAMRTPRNLILVAKTFGASRLKIIFGVVFRHSLPETMSGMRIGIGVALLICLTGEYILGSDGLGYLILGSRTLGLHTYSYIGIFMSAFLGVLLQFFVVQLDRLINPWKKATNSLDKTV
jgi:ABC-type nitrate/sulfonate/bicarbonate transport system permease component